jgi:hypothetical protein
MNLSTADLKDHPCHVCFKFADWFQKRRLLNNFPIGSYVKTMSADGGHFEPRSGSLNTILKLTTVNFQNYVLWPRPPSKMAAVSRHSFNIGPYGKNV